MPRVTGKEDHRISLEAAAAMTRRHRQGEGRARAVNGHYLGRAILEEILAQPGCVGIRMYHAVNDEGEPTMVVVGVDENADDLYKGVIAEQTWPCPPICSAANPLVS